MGDIESASEKLKSVTTEISSVVIDKQEIVKDILATMISGGHILLEDVPGVAKTLTARLISQAMNMKFSRIQFTPDLLPSDITGMNIYDRNTSSFRFVRGPVFTNILLADEINRAPPKTQSALLEAMQEYQVTVDGNSMPLEKPFMVIATQNPIEFEGTYPLPEAQLDRFLSKISFGYPTFTGEVGMLKNRITNMSDNYTVKRIIDAEEFMKIQDTLEKIHVDDVILEYIVKIVNSTRKNPQVILGSSPRGSLAMMKLSRSFALIDGRDYVLPDDVKKSARISLPHRIMLKTEAMLRNIKKEDVVEEIVEKMVPVPKI
ncbi:MAG: AAA family ATPase [Thermoplasmata archaeon]